MDDVVDVFALAQQAASLLPSAPRTGDVQSYLAWRELVWETAARLSRVPGALDNAWDPGEALDNEDEISAEYLMRLARVIADLDRSGVSPRAVQGY